jgi:transcriptional regulator with XRE-family HTH domain
VGYAGMNSAEFRTLREACGLSQQAAAAFHDVAIRTIAHWETGRNSVPAGAAEEIGRLNATLERAVIEAIDLAEDLKRQHGAPDAVALTRYRTEDAFADSRAAREGLTHASHNALF